MELAVSAIKSFFAWAHESGFAGHDAAQALIFPTAEVKLPDIPRLREVEALLRQASGSPEDLLLVLLLADGGLKREEILPLMPDHLDRDDPLRLPVRVPARKTKKVRTVYLPREYLALLLPWVQERGPDEPLFARDGSWISHRVEAIGLAAGIRRPITPATLRHFCAVRMLKAGRTIEEVHAYLGLAAPKDSPIMREIYLTLAKLPL